MALLQWDGAASRVYRAGLDRGVLFTTAGAGVSWNGLTSVDTESDGASSTPVYFNGVKTFDYVTPGDLKGKINAFTYPPEFEQHSGSMLIKSGVYVTEQPRDTFALSYRERIGTAADGTASAYMIHILYGLTATPAPVTAKTMDSNVNPIEFSWDFTGIPQGTDVLIRPTAHLMFDTTKVNAALLATLTDLLYGTSSAASLLPALSDITTADRYY